MSASSHACLVCSWFGQRVPLAAHLFGSIDRLVPSLLQLDALPLERFGARFGGLDVADPLLGVPPRQGELALQLRDALRQPGRRVALAHELARDPLVGLLVRLPRLAVRLFQGRRALFCFLNRTPQRRRGLALRMERSSRFVQLHAK
jgi:hypothetical protein